MHNERDSHGFEYKEFIHIDGSLDDFTLDFEPDDDDLDSGDETDQTTLLD